MWSTKKAVPTLLIKEESNRKESYVLSDGRKVPFQIGTELGYFYGQLIPHEHQENQTYRNSWVLTIDFKRAIADVENEGGYANQQAYYKKALKLAENIITYINLKILKITLQKKQLNLLLLKNKNYTVEFSNSFGSIAVPSKLPLRYA